MDWVRLEGRGMLAMGGALIAIAAALASCTEVKTIGGEAYEAAHVETLPVDPSSSVAADVNRAERIEGPIPSFASVPPKPTDIRAPGAYKSEVTDIVGDRRSLAKWESANPPGVSDTEGYAEAQRGRLAGQTPVSVAQQGDAESFAARLRAAAEAPPRPAAAKPGDKPAKTSATPPSAY